MAELAPPGRLALQGVTALYQALETGGPAGAAALEAWRPVALHSGLQRFLDAAAVRAALARRYRLDWSRADPEPLLLALQTYYALVAKLLAASAAAYWRGGPALAQLLAAETHPARRAAAWRLEETALFGGACSPLFDWYLPCWTDEVGQLLQGLARRLAADDVRAYFAQPEICADLLKPLYQQLLPGSMRQALGEFYTPDWLAGLVLDEARFDGRPGCRLLDPTCGSGTFLALAIARRRALLRGQNASPAVQAAACADTLQSIVGLDVNPLAVLAARAGYIVALGDWLRSWDGSPPPVHLSDVILAEPPPEMGVFDVIVGNPPWIAWDQLPDAARQATKPLWERYGLFSLSANAARHGGAKKDLAMLVVYRAADGYLRDGGRLAMVITQTVFQSHGAGDGFRRFRLGPDGPPLGVQRVNDLVALRPFAAAARAATLLLQKGIETRYPVPYIRWLRSDGGAEVNPADAADEAPAQPPPHRCESLLAAPLDAAAPGSPWLVLAENFRAGLGRVLGPSPYQAYLGANSGGANGVYWLELLGPSSEAGGHVHVRNIAHRGKRTVAAGQHRLEPGLIYPLLRWGDVARWRAVPSLHLLLAQDPQRRYGLDPQLMAERFPRTLAYLTGHREMLQRRAAYRRYQGRGPFWSMYNVGPYTLAPIKVVWRRMDCRIQAAVVEPHDDPLLGRRPVIPQETCAFIAAASADEAHYLAGLLNSTLFDFLVRASSVGGGKGFGSPGLLRFIRLPPFEPGNGRHQALAACSRAAHAGPSAVGQEQIDAAAGEVWSTP